MTPEAVAEDLAQLRQIAAAFGIQAVARHLEQTAQEALAVARTDEEAELARELLDAARRAGLGYRVRQRHPLFPRAAGDQPCALRLPQR